MQLDDNQKRIVAQWIRDGLKLSEIQGRLASELGLKLTYMEARFLVDDLKLVPKDPEPPKPAPTLAAPPTGPQSPAKPLPPLDPTALDEEPPVADETLPGAAKVTVIVDQLTRAGALVSGTVTFSDGQVAQWWVDQMGRMGVAPHTKGYRPSEADLEAFQVELQGALQHLGF